MSIRDRSERVQAAPERLNHRLFRLDRQVRSGSGHGRSPGPGLRARCLKPYDFELSPMEPGETGKMKLTELVQVTTSDGLRLDGSLREPARCRATSQTPDAFLLLHGVGGTFYGGRMFEALTQPLLNQTAAVLRVNTRGAGSVSMFATDGGATRGGAAFEVVDQCRHDIHAWCDFLVQRGYQRIALLGHSLGAIDPRTMRNSCLLPLASASCCFPRRGQCPTSFSELGCLVVCCASSVLESRRW